jgi:CheY-like chemotaxis protein
MLALCDLLLDRADGPLTEEQERRIVCIRGGAEATDGQAGLDSVRAQQPDLIVLDLRMPGLDGFDALDELKDAPETAAIPVVVQTGMTLSPAERDRLAPAVAILDKRADGSDRLTAVVKQLLSVS